MVRNQSSNLTNASLLAGYVVDPVTLVLIQTVAYKIMLPLICAIGILGNALNLVTLRSQALQAVSYMYLRALAVADLFCMIFILVFVCRVSKLLPNHYLLKFYAAHFELPMINFFIASGVLTIVALTVERYISVVLPMHFSTWNTRSKAITAIASAYITCFVLYVPMCWQKHVIRKNCTGTLHVTAGMTANWTNCTWIVADNPSTIKRVEYAAYKWVREAMLRLLPIIALSYFNIHIIAKLRIVQRNRAQMTMKRYQNQNNVNSKAAYGSCNRKKSSNPVAVAKAKQGRDDHRLLLLLAAIVMLFFICNLPAAVNLIFIKDAYKNNTWYQIFRATANILEIANHAVNFYIFCCCSKDFREEFLKKFPILNIICTMCCYPCRLIGKQCALLTLRTRRTRRTMEEEPICENKSLMTESVPPTPQIPSTSDTTECNHTCGLPEQSPRELSDPCSEKTALLATKSCNDTNNHKTSEKDEVVRTKKNSVSNEGGPPPTLKSDLHNLDGAKDNSRLVFPILHINHLEETTIPSSVSDLSLPETTIDGDLLQSPRNESSLVFDEIFV